MPISELEAKLGRKVPIKLWTPLHEVESEAIDQLKNIASLPKVFHHVAVMPDVHFGKGATVGSVVAMKDAVSPAAVGVDIGCGMAAIKTSLKASDLPDSLLVLRSDIERTIPHGFYEHESPVTGVRQDVMWDGFKNLHQGVQSRLAKAMSQIGTLGGGNHFIELCLDNGKCSNCQGTGYVDSLDETVGGYLTTAICDVCRSNGKSEPNVWMMLHSGSRNIGKELATVHIEIAKTLEHNFGLADVELATFLSGTPEMKAYRHDLEWAQNYALINRRVMMELYKKVIRRAFPKVEFDDEISCHHNYVSEEVHYGENVLVTRKGAINAERGRLGIIPGSMGAKSFIVRGLGNPEAFNSASHGAGRRMSRGQAKREFTVDDLKAQTAGVECRKDSTVLDEIPGAYKDILRVMSYQTDLVEVVAELKQCLCVKG
jgi:tRNA-splicing ligase RtcB